MKMNNTKSDGKYLKIKNQTTPKPNNNQVLTESTVGQTLSDLHRHVLFHTHKV